MSTVRIQKKKKGGSAMFEPLRSFHEVILLYAKKTFFQKPRLAWLWPR